MPRCSRRTPGRDGGGLPVLAEHIRHAAARCPAHRVEAGGVALGSELAVAAHLRPDERRVLFFERRVIKSQLHEGLVAQVVHEHVGRGQKLVHDLRSFGGFQVERQPVLVRVVQIDGGVLAVGLLASESRALRALRVAVQGLDLDDLGSHFGQDAHRRGSRHPFAQLDDFDAVQGAVPVQLLRH